MSNDAVRRVIAGCEGMSDDQIIAAYHADYYDTAKPHVRAAFEQLGIEEQALSD